MKRRILYYFHAVFTIICVSLLLVDFSNESNKHAVSVLYLTFTVMVLVDAILGKNKKIIE